MTKPLFRAVLIVIALITGCFLQATATQTEENAIMDSMNESITIKTPKGDLCFTLETLEAIKQKLLETLKKKQPPQDYAHIISEMESANPFIYEGKAYISPWNLIYRNNRLLLEYQQIRPNMVLRVIYTASLEWQDEQWQVVSISIKTVRGRYDR